MANVLTSQTILDGERLAIIKVTGYIDTAETNVVKVNVAMLLKHFNRSARVVYLWAG